tara:strand:+ start:137 stop:457 length:321 start_codon:yes stop_codon:yes gene_type:complete
MFFEDNPQVLPSHASHVIRFDPTGSVAFLGEMNREGLATLIDMWFDSAYIILNDDQPQGTVILPSWYLANGKPLPDKLANALSRWMILMMDEPDDMPDDYPFDDLA